MAGARNRPLRWPHGHFRDPLPRPHCLELIRWVESGGEVVEITRHGKTVARLIPPAGGTSSAQKPWEALRGSGVLAMEPADSILDAQAFTALR